MHSQMIKMIELNTNGRSFNDSILLLPKVLKINICMGKINDRLT